MSKATTYREFLPLVLAIPAEARETAYAELNRWNWPLALDDHKPDGWGQMGCDAMYKLPENRALMKALRDTTSEFGQSRMWWRLVLGKDESAHLAWWIEQHGGAS